MNKKSRTLLGYGLAVAFVLIALVYFTQPADMLPAAFPGHDAASKTVHFKHGLAALILAVGATAYAWFAGGPKSAQEPQGSQKSGD